MAKCNRISQSQAVELAMFLANDKVSMANASKDDRTLKAIAKRATNALGFAVTVPKAREICRQVGYDYVVTYEHTTQKEANINARHRDKTLAKAILSCLAGRPMDQRNLEALIRVADYDMDNLPEFLEDLVTDPKGAVIHKLPHQGSVS